MSDHPTQAAGPYTHPEREALRIRPTEPLPQSPVGSQIARLHDVGMSIEKSLALLRDRLEPVAGDCPPMPEDAARPAYAGSSPHARELVTLADRFERFVAEIDLMRQRLEI